MDDQSSAEALLREAVSQRDQRIADLEEQVETLRADVVALIADDRESPTEPSV